MNGKLTPRLQNCGKAFAKGADMFLLSYHALRYGVLTARGMASGKRVCMVPWAPTSEEQTGRNRKNQGVGRVMTGKRGQSQAKKGVGKGQTKGKDS